MGYHGRHLRAQRHPVVKAVAVSTALVLLVLAGVVVATYRHLEGNITVSNAFDDVMVPRPSDMAVSEDEPTKPLNILVMGSDTRRGQTGVLGDTGSGLSDTTILLHLSADRERAYGVSIPRDLMVPRPMCRGRDGEAIAQTSVAQWNEAYSVGGPACTIAQFEAMSGVRVHHFVVVDFNGFKTMVDALGGVPVCLPQEVDDPIGRIYLPAGSYEVSGAQALDYVRVRHSIGTTETGDIGRMKRQQAFLASMVNKAVSAGTLLNPVRLTRFLNAATRSLTTDPGLAKLRELAGLAREVQGIGLDRVQFFTVPFETYAPDPNRLALAPQADRLWRQLRLDEPLDRQLTNGAVKASKPGSEPGGTKKPGQAAEAARNGLCA